MEKWDLTQEVKDGQAIPRGKRTLGERGRGEGERGGTEQARVGKYLKKPGPSKWQEV